jgi:hypothetical protein
MKRSTAITLLWLIAAATAASSASASSAPGLTRIQTPSAGHVVGSRGHLAVVVRSRAPLRALRISVDGRDITRYFHRSAGAYRATLRPGHGLHPGVDELIVNTRHYRDFDRVAFTVARRTPKLLRLTHLDVGGQDAPVNVGVAAGLHATLRAWVNGHRVDRALQPRGRGYVARLGANDGVRPGRNRLVVLAYRAPRSGRSAVYDVERTAFRERGTIAGAGPDRAVDAGDAVELHGSAAGAGDGLAYHWAVVAAPPNSDPVIDGADTATPEFIPKTPGSYRVRATVTAPNGTSSADTLTVLARADVPPMGWRLETAVDAYGTVRLNGEPVSGTTCSVDHCPDTPFASYAVFNRVTLELEASGSMYYDVNAAKSLTEIAARYDRAPTYLMVVNISRLYGIPAAVKPLLNKLGAGDLTPPPNELPLPLSIIGVPGSPKGSAIVSGVYRGCQCFPKMDASNMSGYLRLNPRSTTGFFEFAFTDQLEFDTDTASTASQIAMKVGNTTYARAVPTDGSSGFFLVRLDSLTLAPQAQDLYVTNNPNGSEEPAQAKRLADDLAKASATGAHELVLLQAFGTPKGTSTGWLSAAAAIGKLRGTPQVFVQLNRKTHDEPHEGRYALVARGLTERSAVESSQALTGHRADGRLHGLLGRDRFDLYAPLMADPAGTVNFDLVRIVNRPSVPGGGFPAFSDGEAAAATYLGRNSDIIGVCDSRAPTCDVRQAYYRDVGRDWQSILTRLNSNAAREACVAASNKNSGFTPEDCDTAIAELGREIGRRNAVAAYLGPKGLQAPFGALQVAALVDVAKLADEIRQAVQPPPTSNATSDAFTIASYVASGLAGFATGCPLCGAALGGLGGAFGLAAYATQQDGSPDLIGPRVTAKAAELGVVLFERYQAASGYFTTLARIIMSDYSKMSEVAAAATTNDDWQLGDIATSTANIRLATTKAIYQSLLPAAYPVLYDLGTQVTDARNWQCIGDYSGALFNKKLFQKNGPGAELTWTMTDGPHAGESHLIAVGARRAVSSLRNAHVPAPPESLTESLFRDPTSPRAGVGLYKLQLFSPQNFELFRHSLQQKWDHTIVSREFGFWICPKMPDPPGNSG